MSGSPPCPDPSDATKEGYRKAFQGMTSSSGLLMVGAFSALIYGIPAYAAGALLGRFVRNRKKKIR